jgi:D-alanyl-D-alanine carboxypeptidase/D-alanyl-D-alanine-endopeptidase (penicillin-binding protein 4)
MPITSKSKPSWKALQASVGLILLVLAILALPQAQSQTLPPRFAQALAQAGIPSDAVSVYIAPTNPLESPKYAHRSNTAMNPASVMKLVTSYAALDILGPSYTWKTPIFRTGSIENGILKGNLIIQGGGNPQMVVEDFWLLSRRLSALGIQEVSGDVLLDYAAFQFVDASPYDFDGQGTRSYNALPQALLLNYSSMLFEFTPEKEGSVAKVHMTPPLEGFSFTQEVALNDKPCADWRTLLRLEFQSPTQLRFAGSYPRSCGSQSWPIAHENARQFNTMLVGALFKSVGITVRGRVATAAANTQTPLNDPLLVDESKSLSQILWGVNKYSNNVMARNIFLSLSLHQTGHGSLKASREIVNSWWSTILPRTTPPYIDNGAGLSLDARISAASLGQMLIHAYQSPLMPEFMATLPLIGIDGTLRRSQVENKGKAHLKTGTMPRSGVSALAGFVHGALGQRLVVVAMINHPNASRARPALDTLIDEAVAITQNQ